MRFLNLSVLIAVFFVNSKTFSAPIPLSRKNLFAATSLPEKLLIGYANWNQCDDSIVRAVEHGVNVIIWFSINLAEGPAVTNGPDLDCVANIAKTLREKGLDAVHLISIGGWNSPHPCTLHSALDMFNYWHDWNCNVAAKPHIGFPGFSGIDWDIEGNDDLQSQFNEFSPDTLDFMGEFSQLAKKAG